MTATIHSCDEVLDPYYMPGHYADSQELFQQKQYFMYSVFNEVLQSDMGKTIFLKPASTLGAHSVWKEMSPICQHPPKVLRKDRLYAYVHITVYDSDTIPTKNGREMMEK